MGTTGRASTVYLRSGLVLVLDTVYITGRYRCTTTYWYYCVVVHSSSYVISKNVNISMLCPETPKYEGFVILIVLSSMVTRDYSNCARLYWHSQKGQSQWVFGSVRGFSFLFTASSLGIRYGYRAAAVGFTLNGIIRVAIRILFFLVMNVFFCLMKSEMWLNLTENHHTNDNL